MEEALEREVGKAGPRITRKQVMLLGGLLVLLVVGYVAIQRLTRAPAAATSTQTATVGRGSLQATVNTAGNIAAAKALALNFLASGQVKTVDVSVGDRVKAGQVLASLDTTELEIEMANAQTALTVAQAKLEQAKADPTAADLAAAQASVKSAQENLAKVKAGPTAAQVAAAQAQIKAAQDSYDTLVAGPDASTLQQAKLKLDQAKNSLWSAQASRDAISGRGSTSPESKDQAKASVANAEVAVQLAQQAYDDAQKPPTTQQIQSALAQLKTAQDTLAKLKPTAAEIASAQSQLEQAQSSLAKLTQGPTAQDLVIAQAAVDQAKLSLQQAQIKLDQAKLVAPFDGTATVVNIIPGQTAGTSVTGGAIGLADTANLEINGQLAEVDIAKIKLGQPAQITLDALPGVTLEGKVTEIAPAGTIQQGVVNYPVTVSLVDPDPAVKPGMTANVNVVVDERQDVLTVPNRAIRTQGRQRFVTVLFEGQMIQTPVQTGLSNDTLTEITGGLKEGDEVAINSTSSTNRTGGGPGGPTFVGGFGGPPPR